MNTTTLIRGLVLAFAVRFVNRFGEYRNLWQALSVAISDMLTSGWIVALIAAN